MGLIRNITITTCLLAGGLLSTGEVFAASSGWMDANELNKFSSKVLRRGKNIPTSIRCKNNTAVVGMSRKNTMVLIGYRPNPDKTKWLWAWGAGGIGPTDLKYVKKGFRKVSSDSFRRETGLVIPCAIWHKKSKK
ncbi:MAG: hypothetical protein QM488_03545 [Rhizobiaceae bacterium]